MAHKPTFPLPKGYFGPTHLTREEEDQYRQIVRDRLASVLQAEYEFTHVQQRQVDTTKWRLVKKKHQLRIYRRRSNPLTSDGDNQRPSMLSVGRVEGTLSDVLYGSYGKSHEELKITMNFVDVSTKDCTVLHNIDLATDEDPFHYLGIKWYITQLPASFIIYPRDWCNMEALGVGYDADGHQFGYFIVHSVDVKNCPPFDRRTMVRGRVQLAFIYREVVPGIVEIFAHGLYDPAGELIHRFSTLMVSEILAGVFRTVQCAEAKKLTVLALKNYKGAYEQDRCQHSCFMCRASRSLLSSLKTCRVCGATVCSQCRVKKPIFIGPAHSICKVQCCRSCIKQAKLMEVRPAEPNFSILEEEHLPQDEFAQSGGFGSSDSNSEPTPQQHKSDGIDTDDLSELDDDGYRFSNDSGIAEADLERIIEAMKHQRLNESGSKSPDMPATAPGIESSPEASTTNLRDIPPEQVAIFERILALQTAAHEAYAITQANNEMMKSFT